jgi:ABC-type multidrug transport system fused ATPase/permease subunit
MFEVVGALLMIAVQQPLLALVSCAITPLLSRLLRAVVVRSSAIIYQRQTVAAEALEYAAERLSQVQTVQVFAQQEREAGAFAKLSGSGYQLAQRYAFFQGVVEGAGRLAVNVGTVALLGFGGWLVIQGRISVGALLAGGWSGRDGCGSRRSAWLASADTCTCMSSRPACEAPSQVQHA